MIIGEKNAKGRFAVHLKSGPKLLVKGSNLTTTVRRFHHSALMLSNRVSAEVVDPILVSAKVVDPILVNEKEFGELNFVEYLERYVEGYKYPPTEKNDIRIGAEAFKYEEVDLPASVEASLTKKGIFDQHVDGKPKAVTQTTETRTIHPNN